MLSRLRPHLTYANTMATIAVFIALGGSSYAATKIGSRQIADNSIRSKDIRNHTLLSKDFKRGQLKRGATGARGATGLQGATGAAGATNVVVREKVATYTNEQYNHVACAAGERATGGGVANPASTFFQFGNEDRMVASAPSSFDGTSGKPIAEGGTPKSWTVGMNGTGTYSVTIYVVCARP
jgi:hypothetical protein